MQIPSVHFTAGKSPVNRGKFPFQDRWALAVAEGVGNGFLGDACGWFWHDVVDCSHILGCDINPCDCLLSGQWKYPATHKAQSGKWARKRHHRRPQRQDPDQQSAGVCRYWLSFCLDRTGGASDLK